MSYHSLNYRSNFTVIKPFAKGSIAKMGLTKKHGYNGTAEIVISRLKARKLFIYINRCS